MNATPRGSSGLSAEPKPVIGRAVLPEREQSSPISLGPVFTRALPLGDAGQAKLIGLWEREMRALNTLDAGVQNSRVATKIVDSAAFREAFPERPGGFAMGGEGGVTLRVEPLMELWNVSKKVYPTLSDDQRLSLISEVTLPLYAHERQHCYDYAELGRRAGAPIPIGMIREAELSARFTSSLVSLEQSRKTSSGINVAEATEKLAQGGSEIARALNDEYRVVRDAERSEYVPSQILQRGSPHEAPGASATRFGPPPDIRLGTVASNARATIEEMKNAISRSATTRGLPEGVTPEELAKIQRTQKYLSYVSKLPYFSGWYDANARVLSHQQTMDGLSALQNESKFNSVAEYFAQRQSTFIERRDKLKRE